MHGENAERHAGREYWSARLPGAPPWGRIGKWLTHRRERAAARRLERKEMVTLREHVDDCPARAGGACDCL